MEEIDGGFIFRGGEYSVTITIVNRRNGRTLIQREIIATEVILSSSGPRLTLDLKSE